MFYLVGLGLAPKHMALEALEALKGCGDVYLETYTSKYAGGSAHELGSLIGKEVKHLDRKGVEESFGNVLEQARTKDIALAVYGNPLSATTHIQLLLDAKKKAVKSKVVAGVSVFDLITKCGLEQYRFGRTVTIVRPKENYSPDSFYGQIMENKEVGLHTLCLLDIEEDGKMMSVSEAVDVLMRIEHKQNNNVLANSTLVGLAGLGGSEEQMIYGTSIRLKSVEFKAFPQCLIVAGTLSDKEREALNEFARG